MEEETFSWADERCTRATAWVEIVTFGSVLLWLLICGDSPEGGYAGGSFVGVTYWAVLIICALEVTLGTALLRAVEAGTKEPLWAWEVFKCNLLGFLFPLAMFTISYHGGLLLALGVPYATISGISAWIVDQRLEEIQRILDNNNKWNYASLMS